VIENILADPNLSKWEYVMTVEDDNLVPVDAPAVAERGHVAVVAGELGWEAAGPGSWEARATLEAAVGRRCWRAHR
jgi:hypothetical protein